MWVVWDPKHGLRASAVDIGFQQAQTPKGKTGIFSCPEKFYDDLMSLYKELIPESGAKRTRVDPMKLLEDIGSQTVFITACNVDKRVFDIDYYQPRAKITNKGVEDSDTLVLTGKMRLKGADLWLYFKLVPFLNVRQFADKNIDVVGTVSECFIYAQVVKRLMVERKCSHFVPPVLLTLCDYDSLYAIVANYEAGSSPLLTQPELIDEYLYIVNRELKKYPAGLSGDEDVPDYIRPQDIPEMPELKVSYYMLGTFKHEGTTLQKYSNGGEYEHTPEDMASILFQLLFTVFVMKENGLRHNDLATTLNIRVDLHDPPILLRYNLGVMTISFKTRWFVSIFDFDRAQYVNGLQTPFDLLPLYSDFSLDSAEDERIYPNHTELFDVHYDLYGLLPVCSLVIQEAIETERVYGALTKSAEKALLSLKNFVRTQVVPPDNFDILHTANRIKRPVQQALFHQLQEVIAEKNAINKPATPWTIKNVFDLVAPPAIILRNLANEFLPQVSILAEVSDPAYNVYFP